MVGVREQKKKETREAIKKAAIKLFAQNGFEQTSIEDIAVEAGIGKTTIYGYFQTKTDVFREFCFGEFEQVFNETKLKDCANRSLLENLIDFFMIQVRRVTADRAVGRILMREIIFPATVDEKSKEHDQCYIDILSGFISQAVENGEIRNDADPYFLVFHFYSLYIGVIVAWYTGYVTTLEEAEESLRKLFGQVLEGVA